MQVSIHKRNQDFSGLHQSIEALKQERAATGTATEQLNAALQVCHLALNSVEWHPMAGDDNIGFMREACIIFFSLLHSHNKKLNGKMTIYGKRSLFYNKQFKKTTRKFVRAYASFAFCMP